MKDPLRSFLVDVLTPNGSEPREVSISLRGRSFVAVMDGKTVAVGESLDEAVDAAHAATERMNERARRALLPGSPVLLVRHSARLERTSGHSGSHPFERILALSHERGTRNEAGDIRDAGGRTIRPAPGSGTVMILDDTPRNRDVLARADRAFADTASRIGEIVRSDDPGGLLDDASGRSLSVAAQAGKRETRERGLPETLKVVDPWSVTPSLSVGRKPAPRGLAAAEVGSVMISVILGDASAQRRVAIRLDPESGRFFARHPAGMSEPGPSWGRTIRECERAVSDAARDHNSREILTRGRHVILASVLLSDDLPGAGYGLPFPDRNDPPSRAIGIGWKHAWLLNGEAFGAAWPEDEDLVDLHERGQINQMVLLCRESDLEEIVIPWSRGREDALRALCDGIDRINATISAGISGLARSAEAALPAPDDQDPAP